jgi:hypothetical protein
MMSLICMPPELGKGGVAVNICIAAESRCGGRCQVLKASPP